MSDEKLNNLEVANGVSKPEATVKESEVKKVEEKIVAAENKVKEVLKDKVEPEIKKGEEKVKSVVSLFEQRIKDAIHHKKS